MSACGDWSFYTLISAGWWNQKSVLTYKIQKSSRFWVARFGSTNAATNHYSQLSAVIFNRMPWVQFKQDDSSYIYILLSQLLSFVFRVLPILASVFAYMKHLTRTLQGRPVPFLCVICKFEHFFAPTSHFPSNGWNAWCVFDYLVFHGSIQNQCVSQDAAVFGEGEKHHCSLLLHLDS